MIYQNIHEATEGTTIRQIRQSEEEGLRWMKNKHPKKFQYISPLRIFQSLRCLLYIHILILFYSSWIGGGNSWWNCRVSWGGWMYEWLLSCVYILGSCTRSEWADMEGWIKGKLRMWIFIISFSSCVVDDILCELPLENLQNWICDGRISWRI